MNEEDSNDDNSARAMMKNHLATLRQDPAYLIKEARIAEYRAFAYNNQANALFYQIGNDEFPATERENAQAFLDFCSRLDPERIARARKLSNSCSQAIKPERAAQSIALARSLFGNFHPHFCASALDERLLHNESRKASWLAMPAEKRPTAADFSSAEALTTRRLAEASIGALDWQLRASAARACYNADPAALRILLDAGFPHSGFDDNDNSPLFMALRDYSRPVGSKPSPRLECARLLLERGADPNQPVRSKPGEMDSPLGTALAYKNWAAAHILLDAGADPYAAYGDNPPHLEAMLEQSAMRERALAIQEQAQLAQAAKAFANSAPKTSRL